MMPTAVFPTTVMTTPDLTTTRPLQMRAALSGMASTCFLRSSLPEEDTTLLTLEPSNEGPILPAESESVLPRTSQRSTEAISGDTALLTSKAPTTTTTTTPTTTTTTTTQRKMTMTTTPPRETTKAITPTTTETNQTKTTASTTTITTLQ
ncbi:T-cell immunoglobulin and mucin domain-containing protein 4-like isoform X1 [Ovis canadensis]|uniref:T-cell immunoglobulin and mucin domain-containing protein 4-like isoform X1 n=1 Tax=Ovis canadensis TaxID=37174 RepID=UPI0037501B87